LVILYIVTGVFAFLAYFIMNNDLLKLQWIAKPLGWIMLISPHFSLVRGMNNLNSIQSTLNLCEKQCSILPMCDEVKIKGLCKLSELKCGNYTSPVEMFLCPLKNSCCGKSIYSFKEDGIGLNIAAMVSVGIISLIVLFIVEYRWVPSLYGSCKSGMR
jgi:ATP-binding cassette, subfamily A (ABC1), member 3